MRFQDIYEFLIKIIKDADVNIYIHARNLRKNDMDFIENVNDDRIKVIEAKSLNMFFLDVFDADLSISVDTAQFHFREGVEKPAIGIYGPFPYECRTKYYKYTKSIDIKSKCPNMPCFIHVKSADSICDFQQELMDKGEYDTK
jgi:ADP-heptose:LPS heptosyltransferase